MIGVWHLIEREWAGVFPFESLSEYLQLAQRVPKVAPSVLVGLGVARCCWAAACPFSGQAWLGSRSLFSGQAGAGAGQVPGRPGLAPGQRGALSGSHAHV